MKQYMIQKDSGLRMMSEQLELMKSPKQIFGASGSPAKISVLQESKKDSQEIVRHSFL